MIARVRAYVESGYLNKVENQARQLAHRSHPVYLLLRGKDGLVCRIIRRNGRDKTRVFKYPYAAKGLAGALLDHLLYFGICLAFTIRLRPVFVYIRRIIPLLPQWLMFMAWCRVRGVRLSYEVPTYPWYQEFRENTLFRVLFPMEWLCNKIALVLADQVPVVLARKSVRLHPKMIPFANGITASKIRWHQPPLPDRGQALRLGTISGFRFWHGFERILRGLAEWKKLHPERAIELLAIGSGPEWQSMRDLAARLGLEKMVVFKGRLPLQESLRLLANCHFAIGTLGSHRKGMDTGMPLKETDFISIGIPFLTDVSHEDLARLSGVMTASRDENTLDFAAIIGFIEDMRPGKVHHELIAYAQGRGSWAHTFGRVADHAIEGSP